MRLIVGNKYKCKAVEIRSYGAIMEMEDGSKQLLHISNISRAFVKNIEDYITIGEEYEVTAVPGVTRSIEITLRDRSDRLENMTPEEEFACLLDQYLPTNRDIKYKHDTSYDNKNHKHKSKK